MKPGQVVGGRFSLVQIAGSGGMGVVFRALDQQTGRPVALKTLGCDVGADTARFQREAEVLEMLQHPAIVHHVAHGVADDGDAYLAMEWLDGEDLSARLSKRRLSASEGLTLARRVAEALAFAHTRGVIHRDLKPANVFLPLGDVAEAKLLDFGIARRLSTMNRTGTGTILGTPGYMAPEQARGDGVLDARVDVFALGCVLVECLAGKPIFSGAHPLAILAKVLFEETPRIDEMVPGIAPSLADLLTRMLAKDPAARPPDATAVLAELESQAAGAERTRAAPSGRILGASEQRFLSVVIAIERAHAADPRANVERALGRLRPVALRFDLELEALADGSLIATMTSTGVASDRASRCARFALALRTELPDAIVALSTGRGLLGTRTPIGPVIDRAATLAASAGENEPDGSIHIDEITAGLLEPNFFVERRGGRFFLHGERGPFDTVRTLLGRPTPCVGRERDLAWLDGILAECAEDTTARAVVITAPPGMGKSRLLHEWLRRVRGREEEVTLLIARGDPIREGVPYGLLAMAIRGAFGLHAAVDNADALIELSKNFQSLSDEEKIKSVFLAELGGLPFHDSFSAELRAARKDPALMAERIRGAFQWFIESECAKRTVLLVVDDLHWADSISVQLIDAALRDVRDRAWMVVGLGRPESTTRFPRLWAERGAVEARLRELPRRAADELARVVLGEDVPAATLAHIVALAGGNALYLEELLRALAEGRSEGLPETLLAMVESRITALDAAARQVVRAASILGEVFWTGGVAALLGRNQEDSGLRAVIEALIGREIIGARPKSRFSEQDEYVFRHATLREAAYATLTDTDRAVGHMRAAEWFVGVGREERLVLAEAAEHAEQAGRLFALVGERDAAATAYGHAGLVRNRIGHADVAMTNVVRALELARIEGRSVEELCNWVELLGDASRVTRAAPGLLGIVDPVMSRIDIDGSLSQRASAHVSMARALGATNAFAQAYGLLDRAVALAAGVETIERDARIADMDISLRHGNGRRARAAAGALGPLEGIEEPSILLRVAAACATTKDDAGAHAALARAKTLATTDPFAVAEHDKTLAFVELGMRRWEAAAVAAARGVERARALGLQHELAINYNNLAFALYRSGEHSRARAVYAEADEVAKACGNERISAESQMWMAFLDKDAATLSRIADMSIIVAAVSTELDAYLLRALLLAEQGERAEAIRLLKDACVKADAASYGFIAEDLRGALAAIERGEVPTLV